MAHSKKDLIAQDTETLVKVIAELQLNLKKKSKDLKTVREKLLVVRLKVLRMKETVKFQRNRILELHP